MLETARSHIVGLQSWLYWGPVTLYHTFLHWKIAIETDFEVFKDPSVLVVLVFRLQKLFMASYDQFHFHFRSYFKQKTFFPKNSSKNPKKAKDCVHKLTALFISSIFLPFLFSFMACSASKYFNFITLNNPPEMHLQRV